jgi:drug/metabolite transporter (DMT)-like permease
MNPAWGPMLLATLGYVSYHLLQKNVPGGTSPLLATAIAYGVGFIACAGLFTLSGGWSGVQRSQFANPATLGVGLAIVAIEVGFLLAYRAGGPLGSTALWVSSVANVLLFAGAVVWGGERLDLLRALGALLTVSGVLLLSRP